MAFEPFYDFFPDIAAEETRNITVLKSGDLPKGTYSFFESFCNDEACDCRRVFVTVYSKRRFGFRGSAPLATISFGWEDESFYRKWASFPLSKEDLRELKGPALVSKMAPQSEYAPKLLEQFKILVRDRDYVDRIADHYRMFRKAVDERTPQRSPAIQRSLTPIRHQPKTGRNQPCPCGSGKKYKKCCMSKEQDQQNATARS
jgi:hypothetical protein